MRGFSSFLPLAVAAISVAGVARADPAVSFQHAVARVTVIPEARGDVSVTVVRANPRLPLKISKIGDTVIVDGGLGWRSPNCHTILGRPSISVFGLGGFGYDALPQVVVRTPRRVHVGASGAVFGAVQNGDGIDLSNSGCGDWTVADQAGPANLHVSGSGDVHAGSAASAEVGVSGSGDVSLRDLRGGLKVGVGGSGDVTAATVNGPLHVHVAGSGDVHVRGGSVTDMDVAVAGSGDVTFGGVAQSLNAQVAGSGDVSVAKVTGSVSKHVAGSGDVNVGH